nr:syntaxin-8 isoform X4 [Odocoileus virginianus texanus]
MLTARGLKGLPPSGKNGWILFENNFILIAPSCSRLSLSLFFFFCSRLLKEANWSGPQSPGKRFRFSLINRLEALGFSTYDSTCQIAQEIAEKVQQRNQYERNGENTTKLTVTIRALLQKLKEKIALLKDLLLRAVATHQITQLEGDRRQNLLDDLVTRERLLLASFKNEGAEPDLIRSSLMTGGAKRGAPNPWLLEEPEETRGLGFDEIRQQQQKIIQEQDAGLDALSSIISRHKQMGQEIGNELDEQNEIIDDLANLVENTDEKLRTETRRVNLVDRKSTSCAFCLILALSL